MARWPAWRLRHRLARLAAMVALSCAVSIPAAEADAVPPLPCGGTTPCTVPLGRYYALPPPGWDGKAAPPAAIFFHGWQATGLAFASDPAFTAPFARGGMLLVLPDGLDKTWAHQGSPSRARDEIAFMDQVRADLLRRWAVDPRRLLVSGFSQGGSMAWDLACRRGRDYRAFAPVSGAFWEPLPERCDGGPVDLLHIHGTADTTVPMAGRAIGDAWRQGDVRQGLMRFQAADRCPAAPTGHEAMGTLRCEVWTGCGSGRALRLCLHPGNHAMPEGWVPLVLSWFAALPDQPATSE